MNEKWEQIEKAIKAATKKTISLKKRQRLMSWWDEECRIETEKTEKRNQLRTKAMQTKEAKHKEAYEEQK